MHGYQGGYGLILCMNIEQGMKKPLEHNSSPGLYTPQGAEKD